MPRVSAWKGHLQVSLVSVPVRSTPAAASGGGKVRFNQLHAACHSRIRYKKVCPEHGEVTDDEIVLGYEYEKGKYVVLDEEEIEAAKPGGDRGISVETFAPAGSVDPLYLAGKDYYLTPDGTRGRQPYSLIRDVMTEAGVEAVAKAVLSSREQLVLIRPVGKLLVMSVLDFESQVKPPGEFEAEVGDEKADKKQLALARQMVDAMTSDGVDLSAFKDEYTERLTEVIEAKVEGREVVTPPAGDEPVVINLMEALKQSVARVKRPGKTDSRPGRKMAPSRTKRATGKAATAKAPAAKVAAKKTGRKKTG